MSRLSLMGIAPVYGEKRPTFTFLRRIRDHPKLSPDALRSQLEMGYPAVVSKAGDSIVALVEEWVNEWLVDARTDADVEKRLEGMVEEVTWGNVIWFAVGGWQARGDDRGRTFNADFFVWVQLQLFLNSTRANAEQCTSCHVLSLLTHPRSSLGPFSLSPCAPRESRDASQGVPRDFRRMVHFARKWRDPHRAVLLCHR
jgi:hypothetical protein